MFVVKCCHEKDSESVWLQPRAVANTDCSIVQLAVADDDCSIIQLALCDKENQSLSAALCDLMIIFLPA